LSFVDKVPDIINSGVGGGIDFNNIEGPAGGNTPARITDVAWLSGRILTIGSILTVDRLGQKPGGGRFSRTARSGQQISVRKGTAFDSSKECFTDMILTDNIGKLLWTMFLIKSHKIKF
jgi:hypothetical protein